MFFLILIYLTFISLGLPDSLLGTAWPNMQIDLNVPIQYAGIISFVISGGTILSSLLSHRLIKRFGTGKITLVSVFLTAIALLGFSLAQNFYFLIILAIPLGVGAGAIDSALNKFVAEKYEAKHMNWLHSFWGLGAIIGPLILALVINLDNGWRHGYLIISLIQFSLVILLFISLKKWTTIVSKDSSEEESLEEEHFKINKKLLIAVLASYFIYMAIENGVILWGATYLTESKGFSTKLAALTISLYFVGITSGRMISGFLSSKLSSNTLIKIGVLIILLGIGILFIPVNSMAIIGIIVIGLGLAPIFPSLLHQTPIYFGKKNAQKMMGRQMAFAYFSTTTIPPLMGVLLTSTSFNLFPLLLLIFGLLIFICTLFIRINKT